MQGLGARALIRIKFIHSSLLYYHLTFNVYAYRRHFLFKVNHLAPFLLTKMLLDTMERSVSAQLPGKIVFTSSEGHRIGGIEFDNLNLEKGSYKGDFSYKGSFISMVKAYGNTKLMVRNSI